jgi:hypothetical protein
VFSKPPEAISDEEYNRWYDFHLGEILVVPGFTSARRYRLQTVKGDWTPSGHRYLSAYEIESDPRDVMTEFDKEVASGQQEGRPGGQGRHQAPDRGGQQVRGHRPAVPVPAVRLLLHAGRQLAVPGRADR